jgi:hypothetical protein
MKPGYDVLLGGDAEELKDMFANMLQALFLAVVFIYLILASQFGSFLQPFAIMLSLPLSLVGVALALLATGDNLNIMSMIGLIMLMGLVTKNAILLVDFANQARREGLARSDALVKAGSTRLRPIVMTTLAMIFGMLPLAFAIGAGAEMRAPMARAVIGGLITSTLLTLVGGAGRSTATSTACGPRPCGSGSARAAARRARSRRPPPHRLRRSSSRPSPSGLTRTTTRFSGLTRAAFAPILKRRKSESLSTRLNPRETHHERRDSPRRPALDAARRRRRRAQARSRGPAEGAPAAGRRAAAARRGLQAATARDWRRRARPDPRGGFPRGEQSEIHGPPSSGRTGVLLALLAHTTRAGALAALVDPLDRLDPGSAAAAGVDLERLLWLRGPRGGGEEPQAKALGAATAAVATLVGSGLFDVVALDLAGADGARRRLPSTPGCACSGSSRTRRRPSCWWPTATSPAAPAAGRWRSSRWGCRFSGPPGPACLLKSLAARARAGRHGLRTAELALAAV